MGKLHELVANGYRSGAGLRRGFEDVIKPDSKDGRLLLSQGFEWL